MYSIFTSIIQKRLPDWNTRVFGMKDFEQICHDEKILFVEGIGREHKGEFLPYENRNAIILRAGLPEGERRWVAFHELGHYYLHAAGHQFSRSSTRRMDREANIFAAVALLPTELLRNDEQALLDGYYPSDFIRIRFEIFKRFGI
jgi:Zn-dependent peptidase ImmA (M78 family)